MAFQSPSPNLSSSPASSPADTGGIPPATGSDDLDLDAGSPTITLTADQAADYGIDTTTPGAQVTLTVKGTVNPSANGDGSFEITVDDMTSSSNGDPGEQDNAIGSTAGPDATIPKPAKAGPKGLPAAAFAKRRTISPKETSLGLGHFGKK